MLLVAAVAAAAACSRHAPGPGPSPGTSSVTAAPTNAAPPRATPAPSGAPTAPPGVQPGARSPLADVNLPAGAVFEGNSSDEERWSYTAPYDDVVAFFRKQFAAGRKYDSHGATWWHGLPPCYNDTDHESPPGGWVTADSTHWVWADANVSLSVEVFSPSSTTTPDEIVIDYTARDNSYVCNRG